MTGFNTWTMEGRRPLSSWQIFFLKVAAVVVAFDVGVAFAVSYMDRKFEKTYGADHLTETLENLALRISSMDELPEPRKSEVLAGLRKLAVKSRPYVDALTSP